MDVDTNYDINLTAEFILSRNFTGVALQFPDELLKDSIKIVSALRNKIRSLRESNDEQKEIRLFVMADTTYGSCCVDEVGASHIDADCVIHYGHTCLSPTSTLPAYFVFGKASINTSRCYENLLNCTSTSEKPILVLYGLEYAYAIPHIREKLLASSKSCDLKSKVDIHFADVRCSTINPLEDPRNSCGSLDMASDTRYSSGGLIWDVPKGHKMDDYLLFWIGPDNSAFANVVLTFNSCEIVRYDAMEDHLVKDVSQLKRILKRRYYLVEKAKDANMVGILVGTLGVAGYLHMIHQMKELIMAAGKKAYVFVMGRPNPAKLANFPECDIFVYVSCAQTALLDSKEFLAPIITPFEAMLAFSRGSQWTGEYVMEFRDLISSAPIDVVNQPEEARYSFLKGGYVEDANVQESTERDDDGTLSLANATERALQLRDVNSNKLGARPKSGAEFFLTRSYHGLEMDANNSLPEPFVIGRSGKASGYKDETTGA